MAAVSLCGYPEHEAWPGPWRGHGQGSEARGLWLDEHGGHTRGWSEWGLAVEGFCAAATLLTERLLLAFLSILFCGLWRETEGDHRGGSWGTTEGGALQVPPALKSSFTGKLEMSKTHAGSGQSGNLQRSQDTEAMLLLLVPGRGSRGAAQAGLSQVNLALAWPQG